MGKLDTYKHHPLATCWHEAAHAVAALVLGGVLREIRLGKDGSRAGSANRGGADVDEEALVFAAGQAVQEILDIGNAETREVHCRSDRAGFEVSGNLNIVCLNLVNDMRTTFSGTSS